jgi:hypothetical protein
LKKRDDSADGSSDDNDDKAVACPFPQGFEIFNIEEREKKQLAMYN